MEGKPPPGVFDFLSMGLASALMIGIGLGIGILVDSWLDSSPIVTFVGLGFGILAAVGSTVRQVRKYL